MGTLILGWPFRLLLIALGIGILFVTTWYALRRASRLFEKVSLAVRRFIYRDWLLTRRRFRTRIRKMRNSRWYRRNIRARWRIARREISGNPILLIQIAALLALGVWAWTSAPRIGDIWSLVKNIPWWVFAMLIGVGVVLLVAKLLGSRASSGDPKPEEGSRDRLLRREYAKEIGTALAALLLLHLILWLVIPDEFSQLMGQRWWWALIFLIGFLVLTRYRYDTTTRIFRWGLVGVFVICLVISVSGWTGNDPFKPRNPPNHNPRNARLTFDPADSIPQATAEMIEKVFGDDGNEPDSVVYVMKLISWAESRGHQFKPGTDSVVRGLKNRWDIGALQVNDTLHGERCSNQGFNIYTLEGNIRCSYLLYKEDGGYKPWDNSAEIWQRFLGEYSKPPVTLEVTAPVGAMGEWVAKKPGSRFRFDAKMLGPFRVQALALLRSGRDTTIEWEVGPNQEISGKDSTRDRLGVKRWKKFRFQSLDSVPMTIIISERLR